MFSESYFRGLHPDQKALILPEESVAKMSDSEMSDYVNSLGNKIININRLYSDDLVNKLWSARLAAKKEEAKSKRSNIAKKGAAKRKRNEEQEKSTIIELSAHPEGQWLVKAMQPFRDYEKQKKLAKGVARHFIQPPNDNQFLDMNLAQLAVKLRNNYEKSKSEGAVIHGLDGIDLESGPDPLVSEREEHHTPWAVTSTSGKKYLISGARIEPIQHVSKSRNSLIRPTRMMQLFGTLPGTMLGSEGIVGQDKGGSPTPLGTPTGVLLHFFDIGDRDLSRSMRRLVHQIGRGPARETTTEEIRGLIDSIHPVIGGSEKQTEDERDLS